MDNKWTVLSATYQLTHGEFNSDKYRDAMQWLTDQTLAEDRTAMSCAVIARDAITRIHELREEQARAIDDTKVEGYADYPTFAVAQWYKNNNVVFNIFKRAARSNKDTNSLAAHLREYVEREWRHLSSPYAELLHYGISSVNWYELAEELHHNVKELDN